MLIGYSVIGAVVSFRFVCFETKNSVLGGDTELGLGSLKSKAVMR
ncbi:hypothetical protein C900_04171 [Fulvivirga imtechensis AK7]|uniref:Uncharacterized protein n=1 Tax=Fulvivirga imtechensis AK7 TaxID=1237149 RepID=L8K062_9BACT|nr:hypothetical protein C900_04171 [Fulvivirga imtechensis AK7]